MAIELLGEVKAPKAAEQLREILADLKDPCRGAAARGLGRLQERSALPLLAAILEDGAQTDELRLDAAEGLCLLGIDEARTVVEGALAASSGDFRAELEESLRVFLSAHEEAGVPLAQRGAPR
jgi:HEAT repeat protein